MIYECACGRLFEVHNFFRAAAKLSLHIRMLNYAPRVMTVSASKAGNEKDDHVTRQVLCECMESYRFVLVSQRNSISTKNL